VLIAVPRPRFRARAERAVDIPGWLARSLLNREDPIGLMNQKPPDLFIVAADFAKNRNVGFLNAAQRFRAEGMRILGLFETQEDAERARSLCDAVLAPPLKAGTIRVAAAALYAEVRGQPPALPDNLSEAEEEAG